MVVVLLSALAFACSPAKEEKPLSVKGEKVYELKGTIVAREAKDNTLRVDHQAIPGFMEAMTMDYSVRGASVAQLPRDGTRITAKLHATDTAYWLTDIRPTP